MATYKSRYELLPGSSYEELIKQARQVYHGLQKSTPRRVPYIRSKYFNKEKVFINVFWEHLNQKSRKERVARLKYYKCALDLLSHGGNSPNTIIPNTEKQAVLYRFYGFTKSSQCFCVQVKENSRNKRKDFLSVYPVRKKDN